MRQKAAGRLRRVPIGEYTSPPRFCQGRSAACARNSRHGGGSFSGKDPTKVDRSASYAARYVAKNIVAAGLADKCEIQLSSAIGVAHPLSIMIDTFGTNKIRETRIIDLVKEVFDLRPAAIIKQFDLRRPIYLPVACYGHFGRDDLDLQWENTDKVGILQSEA